MSFVTKDALSLFKMVYPDIEAESEPVDGGAESEYLVTAELPDGRFFFIVDMSDHTISRGFENKERALKSA